MNKDLILREKLALQRTVLANQSSFLAFLRTSMYFLVAGLSINNLLKIESGKYIEFSFIGISIAILIAGILNYKKQDRIIRKSEIHVGNYRGDYLND